MNVSTKVVISAICGLAMAAGHVAALDRLLWRLDDYPGGGEPLSAAVASTLIGNGRLIGPTCNELAPGSVPQIASGVAGIARSIAGSDISNTAIIAAGLPGCCRALTAADADTRISLGVAIATKARNLAETDLQSAQQVESLVCSTCADVVLSRSYVLARGDDSLGTLIADIDSFDCSRAPDIPFNRTPGGGLASDN